MKHNDFAARTLRLAGGALLAAAILSFTACYYMPNLAGGRGVARASIGVGKSLPAGIASVVLVVGGPGMDTIANTYTVGTTTATLTVPAGVARTFTILANTPSVTFRDDVTVDLAPGETKSITLNPVLAATQIIAPDNYNNNRLVQISDMKGTGWTTQASSNQGFLYPYDVDFDSTGRMYIADDVYGLMTTSDVTVAPTLMASIASSSIYQIAIDRPRGLLYYVGYVVGAGQYQLHVLQVTPSVGTDTLVDLSGLGLTLSYNSGLAVDPDGSVYIVNAGAALVVKINPTGPTTLKTYNDATTLVTPWDILVKGDDVYVSDFGDSYSAIPGKIVRFTKDLAFVDTFSGPADDPFHGPERFVAILNKPITVVDERQNQPGDRLVAFADMTGAGWTTYGASGSATAGPGYFEFFASSFGGS